MDREQIDKWCAWGVLGLMLAILAFGPLATGSVRPQDFVVIQWLTVAVAAVWLVRFWINPKHRLLWAPVNWAILAFVGYAIWRYSQADIEYIARQELIRILVYAVLFFAIVTNLHKQDATQMVAFTLITLATLISMYAFVQFVTESERVWHFVRPEGYTKRGSGTFICPNNLAGYLEMILPLGLVYTMTGRFKHLTKVFLGYCAIVIFVGIAVTVSRGSWLATGLMLMVFFFWLIRQRDFRMQAIILLAAMALIAIVFAFKARFSQNRIDRLATAVQAEDVRFLLLGPSVQMWKDHFWVGVGPAHFDYRFRAYRPADTHLQTRPDRVHNDYLNTLVDWGLIGGVLMVAIWGLFFWEVFRSWKYVQRAPNDLSTKRSNKSSLVMGASLGLGAILIHSFVDFNMHIPANAIVAVTLMAMVVGHFRFATEKHWVTVRWPLRIVVTAVLLAAVGYLGAQAWRKTAECYWLGKAAAAPAFSDEQIQRFERAVAAEPKNAETLYSIGEALRMRSWEGGDDYRELAVSALQWFDRARKLNPYDPYNFARGGMCLHWLGRHAEAEAYFDQARKLDPNSYYMQATIGWHHVQMAEAAEQQAEKVKQFEAAKNWFHQSLRVKSEENDISKIYLKIIDEKLAELARSKK